MSKKVLIVASLIFVSGALSGCIPSLSTGEGGVKEGEFAKGKVVRGFGGDIPLYKSAEVIETFASDTSFGGAFISEDSLSSVFKYYQQSLPQLGWESAVGETGQNNYVFSIKNEQYRGEVIINTAGDGKKTAITVAVAER